MKKNQRQTVLKRIPTTASTICHSMADQSTVDDIASMTSLDFPPHLDIVREILRLGSRHDLSNKVISMAIAWLELFENVNVLEYSHPSSKALPGQKMALALLALCEKEIQPHPTHPSHKHITLVDQLKLLQGRILNDTEFQAPKKTPDSLFLSQIGGDKKTMLKAIELFQKYIIDQKYYELGWEVLTKSIISCLTGKDWPEQNLSTRMVIKDLAQEIH